MRKDGRKNIHLSYRKHAMIDLKVLNESDPLKRMVERQSESEEFSPMAPPDAYAPPAEETISYEDMPLPLRNLMDEHKEFLEELERFEEAISKLTEEGVTREIVEGGGIERFFRFLDERILVHNNREERKLFPLLGQRMLERGEHSNGAAPTSAVDMLEDDHVKLLQLGAVAFATFGLAVRLPDAASRAVTLDMAVEQCRTLVEELRLHMFREDHVVFPMAARLLTDREFAAMEE